MIELSRQQSIIERMRYLMQQSRMSQAEFARRISISPSNLSKHLSGRLPVTEGLVNRIVVNMGVSHEWLRDGTDVPFSKVAGMVASRRDHLLSRSVPIYDIDVTAGVEELSSMFTDDRIAGYVMMPRLSSDSLIVHVSGDSMQPEIIDGGYVAIYPVSLAGPIMWGELYVVVTDDFRRVKYLRRHHTDSSKVVLHSANPDYDDIEIEYGSIRSLFRVEAILNCKILG